MSADIRRIRKERKVQYQDRGGVVCGEWIRLFGPGHARVWRGRGHSSWDAQPEPVALAVARLHPCRGGSVERHPGARLPGNAIGGGYGADRDDRDFRGWRDHRYTAAVDARVAVAAPVCSTYTFGSQAGTGWRRVNATAFTTTTLTPGISPRWPALIAPRPLIILSGQKDSIFPPDGYHEVFRRAKRVYDLHAGGEFGSDPRGGRGGGAQRSAVVLARGAAMDATLVERRGRALPSRGGRHRPRAEDAEALACLVAVAGADARNYSVQHTFTPRQR